MKSTRISVFRIAPIVMRIERPDIITVNENLTIYSISETHEEEKLESGLYKRKCRISIPTSISKSRLLTNTSFPASYTSSCCGTKIYYRHIRLPAVAESKQQRQRQQHDRAIIVTDRRSTVPFPRAERNKTIQVVHMLGLINIHPTGIS
jgi:hypothetical protein